VSPSSPEKTSKSKQYRYFFTLCHTHAITTTLTKIIHTQYNAHLQVHRAVGLRQGEELRGDALAELPELAEVLTVAMVLESNGYGVRE
jgi:hypothetical protein